MDGPERKPGDGSEQSAGACYTQGDWGLVVRLLSLNTPRPSKPSKIGYCGASLRAWTVLLASWMIACGFLPYTHIHMGLKAERG